MNQNTIDAKRLRRFNTLFALALTLLAVAWFGYASVGKKTGSFDGLAVPWLAALIYFPWISALSGVTQTALWRGASKLSAFRFWLSTQSIVARVLGAVGTIGFGWLALVSSWHNALSVVGILFP